MRQFLLALIALALTSIAAPAMAVETGTPAWSIKDLVVYQGPGAAYDVIGDIDGKKRLRVDRCTYRWCLVRVSSVRGWVPREALSFGQEPRGPLTGPRLNYKSGGPGTVCLHDRAPRPRLPAVQDRQPLLVGLDRGQRVGDALPRPRFRELLRAHQHQRAAAARLSRQQRLVDAGALAGRTALPACATATSAPLRYRRSRAFCR
jgi:uncharacterized protein YraI